MKKKAKTVILRAVLPFLLMVAASCSHIPEQTAVPPETKAGEQVLTAIQSGNYDLFRKVCGGRLYSREDFHAAEKNLSSSFGKVQSFRFLTSLAAEGLNDQVWQVSFRKENGRGKEIQRDVLFRIVTGNDSGQERIIAFSFL